MVSSYKRRIDRFTAPMGDPKKMGADCDRCPLRGGKPVWGDGRIGAELAIVGEAPGREEEAGGAPFIGKSGEYMANVLALHKLQRSEVWVTNACLCFPPGGDMKAFLQRDKKAHKEEEKERKEKGELSKTWRSPIDCCRPRLMRELGIPQCSGCGKWDLPGDGGDDVACHCAKPKWLLVKERKQPVSVVAAGNAALEALTGFGGIMDKQMYVFPSTSEKLAEAKRRATATKAAKAAR